MCRKITLFFLTTALLFSACGGQTITNNNNPAANNVATNATSNEAETADAPASEDTPTVDLASLPDELDREMFAQLSAMYATFAEHSAELWTSAYRPDQDQALFVRTDDNDNPLYAYIVNYDNAANLPGAELVETGYHNLGDVYLLREIPNPKRAENTPFFDFFYPIEDIESFMMKYKPNDMMMVPNTFDWQLFVAHEGMHRYQMKNWINDTGFTPGEYNLEAENIALIYLEHKLLISALQAEDATARDTALRQFVAVRAERNARWPETVTVDNAQERGEGMPRYLEYRMETITGEQSPILQPINASLSVSLHPTSGMVREDLSFGRFYATGAALGMLLDELGIEWKSLIEAGQTPYDILAAHYALEDPAALLEVSKNTYAYADLYSTAEQAAAIAESEPVGDMGGGGGGGAVQIEPIEKPYEEASAAYSPTYLPEGYNLLGMFSYSVDEIEFPPIAQIYSPDGADITVVDLGNGDQEANIRISRSAYNGTLADFLISSAIGLPPLDDLDINAQA